MKIKNITILLLAFMGDFVMKVMRFLRRISVVESLMFTVFFLGISVIADAGPLIRDTQLLSGENNAASFALVRLQDSTEDSGLLELQVSVREVKNLKGYGFVLQYDSTKYEFVRAVQPSGKFLGESIEQQVLFVVSNNKRSGVTVSGLRVDGGGSNGDGVLVKFAFKTSQKFWRNPSELDFRLLDGVVIDLSGGTNPVVNLEVGSLRGIPKLYVLEQNVPNPFNPSTSIGYHLSKDSEVKLTIYNVLGQEVRVLVDGYRKVGFYTVVWDSKDSLGKKVASGVYGYQMIADDFISWRKMVLLK